MREKVFAFILLYQLESGLRAQVVSGFGAHQAVSNETRELMESILDTTTKPNLTKTNPSEETKLKLDRSETTLNHTVGRDSEINNFTKHLAEKYRSVFDSLKDKAVENKIKDEIDYLARNYDDKFQELINKTKNETINTKSARRNIIKYTVDSATVILNNLINHLQDNLDDNSNNSNEISADLVKNEASKTIEREMQYICERFDICKVSQSFTEFMLEILTIVTKLKLRKLQVFSNSLLNSAKNQGTEPLKDPITKIKYLAAMTQQYNPFLVGRVFKMMRNIFEHRKEPLSLLGPEPEKLQVSKTLALVDLLNGIELSTPPTDDNTNHWRDIETSLKKWAEDTNEEAIDGITQHLIDYLYKGVNRYFAKPDRVPKLDKILNILML